MDNQIRELSKRYKRKRLLKRVVSLLCVVVLLFTMNTLKRNADTLERIPMCGLSEHTHTARCYNAAGEQICGMQAHVHTDACYQQRPTANGAEDLGISIDGLVDLGDLVEADQTQSLDLSEDLDQGDLLDSVRGSDNKDSNNVVATSGSNLLADDSFADDIAEINTADDTAAQKQDDVVELGNEPVVEDKQEQSAQSAQDAPIELGDETQTEKKQEQPAEKTQEESVKEEEKEQPVEKEEQPAEDEHEKASEDKQEQSAEKEEEQSTEDKQEQSAKKEEERPAEDEQEQSAEKEDEQPSEDEREQSAEKEEEQSTEDEQEQSAEKEDEQPSEDKQEQPAEKEDEQPSEGKQEQPAEKEDEQEQPAEKEEEQPTEDKQEQPAEKQDEQASEDDQEQPAEKEDEQEQPAEKQDEQASEDDQEQPAEKEDEQPSQDEQEQPAEKEEEQPTEDKQEQPAEKEDEQASEDDQEQSAEAEDIPEGEAGQEAEQEAGAESEQDAEAKAEIAYPAQHFEQGTATVNIVVDAPEGAFPEGTVMVVEDVDDQKTINNIEQRVTEDFVEVTSVHAVDISFWYADIEIEPLLPISVVMAAVNSNTQAQAPVVVHVDNNGDTEVVDSETMGAAEAALEMPATADPAAQTFEADSFSVYALVMTQVIETKYIDDSGDTWTIKVGYGKDANLPEGVTLDVTEVSGADYLAEAEAKLEDGKRITKARFFDIKLMDGNREVQPDESVKVTVSLEGNVGEIEADEKQTDVGTPDVLAMHFVEANNEIVEVKTRRATETEDGVTFSADGFSVWGVVYTVDFEYMGLEGIVNLDFTGFDATVPADDAAILYDTEDCNIHVTLDQLGGIIRATADPEADADGQIGSDDNGVAYTSEFAEGFAFDIDTATLESARGGVSYADGELVIAADGGVVLTDGKQFLHINISGLSALKEELLKAEGVQIEVLDGNVPVGSEASYTAHTDEETQALVDAYIENAEDSDANDVAGYSAADLKITRNGEDLAVDGLFQVTVDRESLVPAGMKLENLYHIHNGEVEELAVEQTESGLTFKVENFSDIVASYTVEFYNGDYKVVISGGSQVLLSTLLDELALLHPATGEAVVVDEVASVSFATPGLFDVQEVTESPVSVNGEDVALSSVHDFLITSLKPFDEDQMILTLYDGTVIVIKVTDAIQDSLTTTIKFFAKDAKICKKGEDPEHSDWEQHIVGVLEAPELTKHYYVRAILKDSAGKELGWSLQKVELNGNESTQVTINEFHPFEEKGELETDTEYNARRGSDTTSETLAYKANEHTIETRLYRADAPLSNVTYRALEDDHTAVDDPEDGYEFGGNIFYPDKQNEIDIKKANNKRYKVRVTLDSNAEENIAATDNYYVFAEITHASGVTSYQYTQLVVTDVDRARGYAEFDFSQFMDGNGNAKKAKDGNSAFTGNETSINVSVLSFNGDFKPNNKTNATEITEGSAIKAYKVTYDTRATHAQDTATGYHEEEVTETVDGKTKTIVECIDYINLSSIDAEGQYNYASILGPNLVYGIVADHLYHETHLQTNFAVNHYTGHGVDTRPDLSGSSSGGAIVIAEYNYQATDYVRGQVRNGIGAVVHEEDIAGQLFVGSPLNGNLVAYVDVNSGSPTEISTNGNEGKVRGNLEQTTIIQTDGAQLSSDIVEPALRYGVNMSNELAAHPVTFDPPLPGEGKKLILDTTSFPSDATIYINASRIIDYIQKSGDLEIHKHDDQMIVFNFLDEVGINQDITLAQFKVYQESIPDGFSTNSPEGKGSQENVYMEKVARHIVWNLNNVKGKTEIITSGGIFLQPNENSEIDIKGTTAGWIVSEGLVYNGSGEWHNVFSEMPETSSVKLHAFKKVDEKAPRVSQKFEFFLDEYDAGNGDWNRLQTKVNNTGSIEFDEIKDLAVGWHVYRITENPVKPSTTHGLYSMDRQPYYALVRVQEFDGKKVVNTPMYFKAFDPSTFNKDDSTATGVSASDKVDMITFKNKEAVEGLSLLKEVKGTTDTTREFTFEIELWRYFNNDTSTETATLEGTTYNVVTAEGTEQLVVTNDADGKKSRGTITVKAGEIKTIQGLPSGTFFKITETKVGDKAISTENYVDGYKARTAPQTGSMETDNAVVSVTFENEYKAETTVQVEAKKVMNGCTLSGNDFNFELRKDSADGKVVATATNAADGTIRFAAMDYRIDYSDANNIVDDMADATVADNGAREKVFTYYICEVVPENADPGIAYADPVEIQVKVVDDGMGNLTICDESGDPLTKSDEGVYTYALPEDKDIVNSLKADVTLEGTKTLTGRDMAAGEFAFNAVLTTINGVAVSEETPVTGVEPTSVIGTNVAASAVDDVGTLTAAGNIIFPAITFTEAGVYTFTVTEDTTNLTNGVSAAEPEQSFTATVTVEPREVEGQQRLVANVQYSDPIAFVNTWEGEKTKVEINKQWYLRKADGSVEETTGGTKTFQLWRTTGDISGNGAGSSSSNVLIKAFREAKDFVFTSDSDVSCSVGDVLTLKVEGDVNGFYVKKNGTNDIAIDGNSGWHAGAGEVVFTVNDDDTTSLGIGIIPNSGTPTAKVTGGSGSSSGAYNQSDIDGFNGEEYTGSYKIGGEAQTGTFTLSADETKTITDLPKYAPDGTTEYTYYAVELEPGSDTEYVYVPATDSANAAWTVKNYITESNDVSVKVEKEWNGGEGNSATLYLLRYTKDSDPVATTAPTDAPTVAPTTAPTGSIRLTQNLTGATSYSSEFTATYVVKKDGVEVSGKGGSYTGTNGVTINGLEPGNYTIEVTGSNSNANCDVQNATQTTSANVTAGNTVDANVQHVLVEKEMGSEEGDIWKLKNYHNRETTFTQGSIDFSAGTNVTATIIFNNGYYPDRPFEVIYDGKTLTSTQELYTTENNVYVNKQTVSFTVIKGAVLEIYANLNSISEDVYSNVTITRTSASALSPYQLAFNPFAAYAEEAAAGAQDVSPDAVRDNISAALAKNNISTDDYTLDASFGKAVILSSGHWSETISGLPKTNASGQPYYYLMVEAPLDGYTVAYDHAEPVKATEISGALLTLKATNTKDAPEPGSLTITKTFDGDHAAALTEAQKDAITFTVSGPTGFTSVSKTYAEIYAMSSHQWVLNDLAAGTYTVTESNENPNSGSYSVVTTYKVDSDSYTATNSVTLAEGEDKALDIKNTYTQRKGYLTLNKTFIGWQPNDDQKQEVTFDIFSGETKVATVSYADFENGSKSVELPIGIYTVKENRAVTVPVSNDGYTEYYYTVDTKVAVGTADAEVGVEATVTITEGNTTEAPATVSYTNTYTEVTDLTLQKGWYQGYLNWGTLRPDYDSDQVINVNVYQTKTRDGSASGEKSLLQRVQISYSNGSTTISTDPTVGKEAYDASLVQKRTDDANSGATAAHFTEAEEAGLNYANMQAAYNAETGHWMYTLYGLPKFAYELENGEYVRYNYSYEAIEADGQGKDLKLGLEDGQYDTCPEYTGTVQRLKNLFASVTAEKEWAGMPEEYWPETVTYELTRYINGELDTSFTPLEAKGYKKNKDHYKVYWDKLLRYRLTKDTEFATYTYKVTESVTGYTSLFIEPTTQVQQNYTWHFTNVQTTNLDVTKQWLDATETAKGKAGDTISFDLHRVIMDNDDQMDDSVIGRLLVKYGQDGSYAYSYSYDLSATEPAAYTGEGATGTLDAAKAAAAANEDSAMGAWSDGTTATGWGTTTITGLPKYVRYPGKNMMWWLPASYYVVETGDTGDAVVTYKLNDGDPTSTAADARTQSGTITIINREYTASVRIVKVDKADKEKKLSGAVFKLVQVLPSGGTDPIERNITVNEQAEISGLVPGNYRLTEVTAPEGYVITLKGITFTVKADGSVTYNENEGENDKNVGMVTYTSDDTTFTIGNEKGVALPATGGMGTGVVYGAGLSLILLAVLGFILRKRARDGI